jgi:hypothetical protein
MKINTMVRLSLGTAAALVALLATGCYYMPGQGGGTAKVAIGIAPGAKGLKAIPANLSSVALVVTAPGMAPITATASATANSITVSVPAGPARTFTLLLNTPSATLEGVATVDLQAGQSTTVNVTPTLGATQIVIPDYNAGQVDQISDMTGTGWTTLLPVTTPYAVAFDSLGRLYVASGASIYRMNDISGPLGTAIASSTQGAQITSMAMDLTRGLLYFIDSTNLYSIQVTPSLGVQLPAVTLASILTASSAASAIAVDSDGFLYIANTYPVGSVVKVNVSTFASPVVVTSFTGGLLFPWDIMVKDNYVYVSDYSAKKILRFSTNLQPVDSFPGPTSDPLVGPKKFLAILNKPITLIDDAGPSTPRRLVSFNDMAGDGWTTYGSYTPSTPGVGQFHFYES